MSETGGLSAEVIDGTFDLARTGLAGPLGEMIDAGFPVDARNERGDTMLIVAAYAKQPQSVAQLIAHHAALDTENRMGQTAISCAVFRNDAEILTMLLDAGADPNAGMRTAVQIAEQFGIADMVTMLRSRG